VSNAGPREFVERLERATGWPAPKQVPSSTPITLANRVLAAFAVFGAETVHQVWIEQGYIDTSGDGGGPNEALGHFAISEGLLGVRPDDFCGQPGCRFWIPCRDGKPLAAGTVR